MSRCQAGEGPGAEPGGGNHRGPGVGGCCTPVGAKGNGPRHQRLHPAGHAKETVLGSAVGRWDMQAWEAGHHDSVSEALSDPLGWIQMVSPRLYRPMIPLPRKASWRHMTCAERHTMSLTAKSVNNADVHEVLAGRFQHSPHCGMLLGHGTGWHQVLCLTVGQEHIAFV